MKKIISIALTALMSVTALASCGSTAGGGASETTTGSGAAQTTAASDTQVKGTVSTNGSTSMQKVISTLSEQFMNENGGITVTYDPTGSGTGASEATYKTVDLQQRKIKIYQYGFRKNTITSTESGKRFMNRVAEIEKAFNCVIDLPEDDNYTAVWNATLAGKPSHDIMSIAAPHLFAQPATNGVFMDLSQFKDAFDFSADKWDQDLLQSYQLHGKQYGCSTGTDITGNTVMYFNKRLVKEAGYNPDDLYKWQEDGSRKWSKFKEMATKISKLSSGSTTIWGSVNNAYQLYNNLCVSNGSNWITKDQSGVHFNADDEKCMQAMDFMMELQK